MNSILLLASGFGLYYLIRTDKAKAFLVEVREELKTAKAKLKQKETE